MSGKSIEVKDISVQFKDKQVLNHISFSLEGNKIYGLLGKNGIGKSTLLNTIVGGLKPQTGEVRIDGVNPYKDAHVLEQVCIVREQEFMQPDMRVKDLLALYQIFFPNYDKVLQERLIKFFDLPVKKPYRTYSRGMKTMVSNIIGLCAGAPITLFDEPTIGLDAVNRTQFYEILLEVYSESPRTIILSTHQIDEVENLLEHIIMLDHTGILIDEAIDEVKSKAVILQGKKEALEQLDITRGMMPTKSFGSTAVYHCYGVLDHEDEAYIAANGIQKEGMSLQELFITLTKGEGFKL